MKNLLAVLSSFFLTTGAIFITSFKMPDFNKNAFAIKCFYYNDPDFFFYNKDCTGANRNLVQSEILTTANWSLTTSIPPTPANGGDCNDGEYLCAVCFDDAQYTLAQAINIVWTFYNINNGLPHNMDVDPSANEIKTFRQLTIANHNTGKFLGTGNSDRFGSWR